MRSLANVHAGDELEVRRRGHVFTAVAVGEPVDGQVQIRPLLRWVSYRWAQARHVVKHRPRTAA